MRPTIYIFTALRFEAAALAKLLGLAFRSATIAAGRLDDGREIELHAVGPRCGNLRRDLEMATCRGIIMAGLAGALDPALKTGEVVIDASSEGLPSGPGWRRGTFHTAADVIATPSDKEALFRSTGALVVDMENAVARQFARERGVPFLGIRAVSDAADVALDPAVMRFTDEAGRLRPGRLAAELLRRPAIVPTLWRLRAASALALSNLAAALRQILRETPADETPEPAALHGS